MATEFLRDEGVTPPCLYPNEIEPSVSYMPPLRTWFVHYWCRYEKESVSGTNIDGIWATVTVDEATGVIRLASCVQVDDTGQFYRLSHDTNRS